jgi:hypothetical protein
MGIEDASRIAGTALGSFVLFYTSLQWAHYRRLRKRAEEAEAVRKERQEKWKREYDERVKNNMRGFEKVSEDDS